MGPLAFKVVLVWLIRCCTVAVLLQSCSFQSGRVKSLGELSSSLQQKVVGKRVFLANNEERPFQSGGRRRVFLGRDLQLWSAIVFLRFQLVPGLEWSLSAGT